MLLIDRGEKDNQLYEYYPQVVARGRPVPSFDIGPKHFGVYVEDDCGRTGQSSSLYAGLWYIGERMDLKTQTRLTALLTRLDPFFAKAERVLVERQRMLNYAAVRLEQHVLSYLELRHPHLQALTVPSDLKYRQLDGPLGTQKHRRKQWAVDKACEMLEARDDAVSEGVAHLIRQLEGLKGRKLKGDDIADAFVQYEAWKRKQ
jgi:hypothetical protein